MGTLELPGIVNVSSVIRMNIVITVLKVIMFGLNVAPVRKNYVIIEEPVRMKAIVYVKPVIRVQIVNSAQTITMGQIVAIVLHLFTVTVTELVMEMEIVIVSILIEDLVVIRVTIIILVIPTVFHALSTELVMGKEVVF